jgi:hypothetical protein
MGKMRNAYNILVGKPVGNRPVGRPRRRWDDNIIMDVREIGWEGVNWMHLVQVRYQWRTLLNMKMKLRVPENAGNFLSM